VLGKLVRFAGDQLLPHYDAIADYARGCVMDDDGTVQAGAVALLDTLQVCQDVRNDDRAGIVCVIATLISDCVCVIARRRRQRSTCRWIAKAVCARSSTRARPSRRTGDSGLRARPCRVRV
jgi:hypothetical protein